MIRAVWKTYLDAQEDIAAVRGACGADVYEPADDDTLHVVAYEGGKAVAAGRVKLEGERADIDGICAIPGEISEATCDLVIRMLCSGAVKSGCIHIAITAGLELEKLILPLGFIRAGEARSGKADVNMGYYAARAETVTFSTCKSRGN